MAAHAAWRALLLVLLGIFLRSVGALRTNFTFEDTLSQIGLGYFPLFLLGMTRPAWQWLALGMILFGNGGAFALYPLPGPDFDYAAVGVPSGWPHHLAGFAGHWDKNSNLAWAFDTWFLNLFNRAEPFTCNRGGYATLSFIPTLATMILGLLAGGRLKQDAPGRHTLTWLTVVGLICLLAGFTADALGVCPSVKRIWTPAWVLFSGGWCFLLLAGFHAVMDVGGWQAWAFPLRVIGMNSIAAYCLAHLVEGFILQSFKTHLGPKVFQVLGKDYEPLLSGVAVLLVLWLILFWMYRRRLFLRI
jgi:predicted acyltransferase